MSPKVHTPTEDVTAVIAGVAFTCGVGETDDEHALNYFRRHGYRIENEDTPTEVTIPDGDPAESWKVDQLKAYAKREGITLGDAKNKPDILAALLAAKPSSTPPPPPAD